MDFKAIVKSKYSYLSDSEATLFVNKAKSICIEQIYPAALSINYLEFDWENFPRYDMWILDCVDELIERVGISSAISYRENNISWTFDRAGISQALLDRLQRIVGVV